MELMKIVLSILLVILLAACSAQGSVKPAATESQVPVVTTSAPAPLASPVTNPSAQPTETPELSPSPTTNTEPVFIVSDEVWAGAKELIQPDGDWLPVGYVFVEPGTEIRSPYDAMASFQKYSDPNGSSFCSIILTARPDKSENPDDLWKVENYPIHLGAVDITPAFGQYEMVKEGEVIGTVNSSKLDIPPEEQQEYGGYNLIINSIRLQDFGIEEPFADELTLKDKIRFIVELAKKAQSEPTKED